MLILAFGCRPAAVSKEKSQAKKKISENSLFNPLELSSDTIIVPEANPLNADLFGESVKTDIGITVQRDSLKNTLIEPVDSLNSQTFRIQLFSSKVYGASRQEFLIAEEIFDRNVYLDYEVPYYKIRVGDFSNREDAEIYLLKVRTSGYSDAWVVAVNINVRESERLYKDSLFQMESDQIPDESDN